MKSPQRRLLHKNVLNILNEFVEEELGNSKPATVRFEGRCPGGVRRVWAEADNDFHAALECMDAAKDYVRRRPDTGPAEKWELYKTKPGQQPKSKKKK
jgi:hypothetical protein